MNSPEEQPVSAAPQSQGAPYGDYATDSWAEDEISLFELGSTLLENRGRIVRWGLLGAVLAVAPVLFAESTYTSSATVISVASSGDGGSSAALRGLAQQFGVNVGGGGGGNPLATPGFLIELASSPVILNRIIDDTLDVPEVEPSRVALIDLLSPQAEGGERLEGDSEALRRLNAFGVWGEWVSLSERRNLDLVELAVTTEWPSVSFVLANRVLEELNRFNLEVSQGQASEERRFVEQRIAEQEARLAAAEQRLGSFLEANRQFRNSPDLIFQHDRLQGEVALQQQVLVSLAQLQEDVRLREVRDTPVLRIIESPTLPVLRDPKGRVRRGALGLIAGGMIGVLVAFVAAAMQRRREEDDPEAERFMTLARETLGPLARLKRGG